MRASFLKMTSNGISSSPWVYYELMKLTKLGFMKVLSVSSESSSEKESASDKSPSMWLAFFLSGFFSFKRLDRIMTPSGWASKTFWRQDYCCLAYSRERKCSISVLCLPCTEKTSTVKKMRKRLVFEEMNPSRSKKQFMSPWFELEKAV